MSVNDLPAFRLLPWVQTNFRKLDKQALVHNPNAIDLMDDLLEKVDVNMDEYIGKILPYNDDVHPKVWQFILERIKYVTRWVHINKCRDPKVLKFLYENPTEIMWDVLGENEAAIDFLEENIDNPEMVWSALSANLTGSHLLRNNLEKVDWYSIRIRDSICPGIFNKDGLDLIRENIEQVYQKINWSALSEIPEAIDILERYPEMIDYEVICNTPAAFDIIKENIDELPNLGLLAIQSGGDERFMDLLLEYSDEFEDEFHFEELSKHYHNPRLTPIFEKCKNYSFKYLLNIVQCDSECSTKFFLDNLEAIKEDFEEYEASFVNKTFWQQFSCFALLTNKVALEFLETEE
eukprot:765467-Hanusia_phi.AAC.1